MTCVRSGVTKPFATVRPASSSSLATATSISPTPGVSASTGRLPPSARRHRQNFDVIGGGAGALRDAGDRGRLHREAGFGRRRHDPVGQHAAAFAAERGDQQVTVIGRAVEYAAPSPRGRVGVGGTALIDPPPACIAGWAMGDVAL